MATQIDRTLVESIVREVVSQRMGRPSGRSRVGPPSPLVVNVSARHMHISQEDLVKLFGPGSQLTPHRPLYQDGNFAAREMVTLVGPKNRLISNLRILGPMRKQSQIELAFTDAITLGIENIPIRVSGDIAGTPGAYVMGPKGLIELPEGVIRAAMHVHMNPADAAFYGVKHKDIMKLKVGGNAGITFDRVHVRIDPAFKLEVHMDTDEANACGIHLSKEVELVK